MFSMTEAAGGYLTRMLEEAQAPQDTAVRFVLDANQVKPTLDKPRPGDQALDHAGRKVLLLDTQVQKALATSVLDIQDGPQGPKLVLVQ